MHAINLRDQLEYKKKKQIAMTEFLPQHFDKQQ